MNFKICIECEKSDKTVNYKGPLCKSCYSKKKNKENPLKKGGPCVECGVTETPQWYNNKTTCKPCYRKHHRSDNLELYKNRDQKHYQSNQDKIKVQTKERYWKDPEVHRERRKETYRRHGTKRVDSEYEKKWRVENKDKCNEYKKEYKEKYPDKVKKWGTDYNKRHPQVRAFHTAKRRAAKLRATPPWLTEEHWEQIRGLYEVCPKNYHVDHMVPLQGKTVCGLHVPWNLQIIPAEENLRKNNTLELLD